MFASAIATGPMCAAAITAASTAPITCGSKRNGRDREHGYHQYETAILHP
jgi:hypothetical protein